MANTELVLIPETLDAAALGEVPGVAVVRYDDLSEAGAVPVARGLRAVPPRRLFAVGRARVLGTAGSPRELFAVAWAVRANLLPDRANAEPLLTRVLATQVGARLVGAVSTADWLGDDEHGREQAARLAELTAAEVENPACFSLLAACARLEVPVAVLLGSEPAAAVSALAVFLASEHQGPLIA